MTQPQRKPDWVMLGVPLPNGMVAIYASKELEKAEIGIEDDYPEISDRLSREDLVRNTVQRIFLNVRMKAFVCMAADTYPQALAGLLREWEPSAPEQKEILS